MTGRLSDKWVKHARENAEALVKFTSDHPRENWAAKAMEARAKDIVALAGEVQEHRKAEAEYWSSTTEAQGQQARDGFSYWGGVLRASATNPGATLGKWVWYASDGDGNLHRTEIARAPEDRRVNTYDARPMFFYPPYNRRKDARRAADQPMTATELQFREEIRRSLEAKSKWRKELNAELRREIKRLTEANIFMTSVAADQMRIQGENKVLLEKLREAKYDRDHFRYKLGLLQKIRGY